MNIYTTPIEEILQRLGMSQYRRQFCEEGFDSWETLLDITESDLEALGVKLGHRRKLQRAIMETQAQLRDHLPLTTSPQQQPQRHHPPQEHHQQHQGPHDQLQGNRAPQKTTSAATNPDHQPPAPSHQPASTKRKYRRHPKPDGNAPERPPSAYVIFSNQMREMLRGQDLSFTEIAKLVGERWQRLELSEKQPCERQAQEMKETYYSQLAEYKKTARYAKYQDYLAEFKAKHNPQSTQDAKRPKTSPEFDSNTMRGDSQDRSVEDEDASNGSSREAASPASTTTHEGHDKPRQDTVTRWRIGLQSPFSSKVSPTAGSPQQPLSGDPHTLNEPPVDRPPASESSGSMPWSLPVHRLASHNSPTSSHSFYGGYYVSARDIESFERHARRSTLNTESLPSLTRDDTAPTTASHADSAAGADHSTSPSNALPAIDGFKGAFSRRTLPPPTGLLQSAGTSSGHRSVSNSSGPTPQPTVHRPDPLKYYSLYGTSTPDSAARDRNLGPANTINQRPSPSEQSATGPRVQQQSHPRDRGPFGPARREEQLHESRGERAHDRQHKAQATMGFATLLRASEQLDRDTNRTSSPHTHGSDKKQP